MQNLKRNSWHLLFLLLASCTTSSYKILHQDDGSAELSISPDRVLLECEWLYDADVPGLFGFMIHVLDEKNTVLTINQGNTLDKNDCESRIQEISKILNKGRSIYIAGIGNLNEPRSKSKTLYNFPKKGIFEGNERTLQFVAIANEHGACYDAYSGSEKPCPRKPFPTQKKK
jgi:hypothetical protein